MQIANFLVAGLSGSGKTTFIQQVTNASGTGALDISENLKIQLYESSVLAEKKLAGMLGVIVIIDGSQNETVTHLPAFLAPLHSVAKMPFILAVNRQYDTETLRLVREQLPEDSEVKVFPWTGEPQSAQNVLLALIYQILG